MIYAFIRGYIGGFGRVLLDFYTANSFVINAIILIYALSVYLAHLSHHAAYRSVLEALGYDFKNRSKEQKEKMLKSKMKLDNLDWNVVRRSFWFPFMAAPHKLLIRLKTNTSLQMMFDEKNIKELLKSDQ